jgi:peptidoglycan biosynthesis protein MviN/MurJ (putative lipid II flippase)
MILLNIPLNLILIWPLGTGGLALSTAICAALNLAILTRLLHKRIQRLPRQADQAIPSAPLHEVAACLPRILLATALMAAAAFGALRLTQHLLGPDVAYSGIRLAAALFAGVLVYYLAAKFLKCRELPELLSRGS